jgi:hypothetical protein
MTVLRVCQKYGVRFDEVYYLLKHLPLTAGVMGPFGAKGVEVVKLYAFTVYSQRPAKVRVVGMNVSGPAPEATTVPPPVQRVRLPVLVRTLTSNPVTVQVNPAGITKLE